MMKPHVGIFSDDNFLAITILENLLSKKCFVSVYTDSKTQWEDKTGHLQKPGNFEILPIGKNKYFNEIDYCIFLSGFLDKDNLVKEMSKVSAYKFINAKKSILVLPLETYKVFQEYKIVPSDNLALVYVSDIIGPRIDLESSLLMARVLYTSLYKGTIDVGIGEKFYPVYVFDAARILTSWLFSFGPYGKETAVMGDEVSVDNLRSEFVRRIPNLKTSHNLQIKIRFFPRGIEIKKIGCNLRYVFNETLSWLSKITEVKNYEAPQTSSGMDISPKFKKTLWLSVLSILLAASPFMIAFTSFMFLKIAYSNFINGDGSKVKNLIYFAKMASVVGKYESKVLTYMPFVGRVYKESYFINILLEGGSEMAESVVNLSLNASELMSKVMGNDIYDPNIYAQKITPDLDYIYQSLAFMEAEANTQVFSGGLAAKKFISKVDIARLKLVLLQGKILINNLPQDIGTNGSKTYLVLFQNNMELRPAGGFIGSYGLLSFEEGRMTDLSVSDVYSADGQLKGHVEPPAPIKKYLGEANWWLRDSNWDPDFTTSGKRAEWFLDKEIDRKVDGVIGLDLETVKKLLTVTGPISLPDYNLDITQENLYEKTQAEVENKFFAGSTKKASFLTALSRNLIMELEKLQGSKKLKALKTIFDGLEERHVQIYTHNEFSQNAYSDLAWSGEVKVPTCGGDCYAELVGTVEANVGVNKSNYYITRKQTLDVKISGNKIESALAVELTNNANPSLGTTGIYKNYIRLLTNANSEIHRAMVVSGESNEFVDLDINSIKDRKESGMYLEIYPGQTKKIVFNWKDNLRAPISDSGEYRLYVRKQAGIGDFPTQIKVRNSSSLTNPDGNVYNTMLARDFFSRITW